MSSFRFPSSCLIRSFITHSTSPAAKWMKTVHVQTLNANLTIHIIYPVAASGSLRWLLTGRFSFSFFFFFVELHTARHYPVCCPLNVQTNWRIQSSLSLHFLNRYSRKKTLYLYFFFLRVSDYSTQSFPMWDSRHQPCRRNRWPNYVGAVKWFQKAHWLLQVFFIQMSLNTSMHLRSQTTAFPATSFTANVHLKPSNSPQPCQGKSSSLSCLCIGFTTWLFLAKQISGGNWIWLDPTRWISS